MAVSGAVNVAVAKPWGNPLPLPRSDPGGGIAPAHQTPYIDGVVFFAGSELVYHVLFLGGIPNWCTSAVGALSNIRTVYKMHTVG